MDGENFDLFWRLGSAEAESWVLLLWKFLIDWKTISAKTEAGATTSTWQMGWNPRLSRVRLHRTLEISGDVQIPWTQWAQWGAGTKLMTNRFPNQVIAAALLPRRRFGWGQGPQGWWGCLPFSFLPQTLNFLGALGHLMSRPGQALCFVQTWFAA